MRDSYLAAGPETESALLAPWILIAAAELIYQFMGGDGSN